MQRTTSPAKIIAMIAYVVLLFISFLSKFCKDAAKVSAGVAFRAVRVRPLTDVRLVWVRLPFPMGAHRAVFWERDGV